MNLLLSHLLTEERNPASMRIDLETTEGMLRIINQEDQKVATAVAAEIPQIAKAVDLVTEAFRMGGRLFYVGAGTSGRLGILDASECPPTFNVCHDLVQGVMAGGMKAAVRPVEASEDSEPAGASALKKRRLTAQDVVAGIAASGRTPYTLGAMKYAKSIGAKVLSITCNPNSKMAALADVSIAPVPGPEVVTGSTRMKVGDCAKAGAQYDHNRQHDQTRLRLQQPDDSRSNEERETAGAWTPHHHVGYWHRLRHRRPGP